MFPDLSLPPEPCITRWGSWLKAAIYYCENYSAVEAVVATFNDEDAESICLSKEMFAEPNMKTNLAYIKNNFTTIVTGILKLETQGLSIDESITVIEAIQTSLKSLRRKEFSTKLDAVLTRNRGFNDIVEIRNVLFHGSETSSEYVNKLSSYELSLFKFCPLTTSDVERSFSFYNNVLTDNRKSFLFENLKQHMIVNYNRHISE